MEIKNPSKIRLLKRITNDLKQFSSVTAIAETGVITGLAVIFQWLSEMIFGPVFKGGFAEGLAPHISSAAVLLIVVRRGWALGFISGFLTAFLMLVIGAKGVIHITIPGAFLLDQFVKCGVAYALAGIIALVFINQKFWIKLLILSVFVFIFSMFIGTISGVLFYAQYTPSNMFVWTYSFVYNITDWAIGIGFAGFTLFALSRIHSSLTAYQVK